jgi:hypothetical protein
MYIISVSFDPDLACMKAGELLALGDSPERLAERLGITRDLDTVKRGVAQASFTRLLNDLTRIKQYVDVEKQIEDVKNGKTMLSFLGAGHKDKQIAKLKEQLRKFGALIEAPRWFYSQPRVRVLSAIRDYALDGAQQGDADWKDVDEKTLVFPIAEMYENMNRAFAETLIKELEKPLRDVDPRYLLEKFEGNRSITFDFGAGTATYYTPAPAPSG